MTMVRFFLTKEQDSKSDCSMLSFQSMKKDFNDVFDEIKNGEPALEDVKKRRIEAVEL